MSTCRYLQFVSLMLCVFVGPLSLAENLEEGQALAKAKGCFECHGKTGNTFFTTEPVVPVIAEQSYEYLRKAMQDYKYGARSGTIMSQIMSVTTDKEIDLLAEYYAAQERY